MMAGNIPHNRRVAAAVIRGRFPYWRQQTLTRLRSLDMSMQERRVVIPIAAVASVTTTMVQLDIDGMAAARCDDFSVDDFTLPDAAWRPPYPYGINPMSLDMNPATEANLYF